MNKSDKTQVEIHLNQFQTAYMHIHLSLKYFTKSHMMIGRFSLSLYVGNRTEYLSLSAIIPNVKDEREGLMIIDKNKLNHIENSLIQSIFIFHEL